MFSIELANSKASKSASENTYMFSGKGTKANHFFCSAWSRLKPEVITENLVLPPNKTYSLWIKFNYFSWCYTIYFHIILEIRVPVTISYLPFLNDNSQASVTYYRFLNDDSQSLAFCISFLQMPSILSQSNTTNYRLQIIDLRAGACLPFYYSEQQPCTLMSLYMWPPISPICVAFSQEWISQLSNRKREFLSTKILWCRASLSGILMDSI